MQEKYGVVANKRGEKLASEETEIRCPICGKNANSTSPPSCADHGTEPFEECLDV